MSKKNLNEQKISKKEAKSLVYNKLAAALSDYKKNIKPKKFEAKLKKASKLFATDIAKAAGKVSVKKIKKGKAKIKPASKNHHEAAS